MKKVLSFIMLFGLSISLMAQITIHGTVKSAQSGKTLPGVSVAIKGTTRGTITDLNGNYSMSNVSKSATLVFSFVGMRSQEVAVNGRSVINVALSESVTALKALVVVGYGVQKKVDLTGAVSVVEGNNIAKKPVTQLSAALEGMSPGVTVVQSTGQPGLDGGTINIRGIGTLNNTTPLVLVDGVVSNINDVNPDDIQSISILKDAASSAIYGVRAANGVILITTKRGTKGKPKVSYSYYFGYQKPTFLPNFVGAQEYMKLVNLTYTNGGSGAIFTDAQIAAYNNPDRNKYTYPNVNWVKAVLEGGNGFQEDHNISVSGGAKGATYRFSANYLKQNGLVAKTNFKRLTLRWNSTLQINKHLSFSADMSGYFSGRTEPQGQGGGIWFQFEQAITSNPTIPIKYENGDWTVDRGDGNPIRLQHQGGIYNYNNNAITGNFKGTYNVLKGLSFVGVVNTTFTTDFTSIYNQALTYNLPGGGTVVKDQNELTKEAYRIMNINYQGLMHYNKTIGSHNFTLLLGVSKIQDRENILTAYRNDGSLFDLPQLNAGDPSSQTNTGYMQNYALLSYFGRFNYVFKDKYLFEADLRKDASSFFAPGHRWGTFPSFSAGWRISKESFMKNIHFINELKIRGSWGELGNDQVGNYYAYQSLINLGYNYPFGESGLTSGAQMSTYPNASISWETTKMTDIGLDATVLHNSLNFTFDYYVKNTSNILLQLPIPESVGLNAPIQNAGGVQNKGWGLSLSYKNMIGDNFKYGIRFNLSNVDNKITDLRGQHYLSYNSSGTVIWSYFEGQPIEEYYGYVSKGIIRTQAQADAQAKQFGTTPMLGDIAYKDLNGDGNVNSSDRTFLGSDIPKYTYSFNINASYKNFDFNAFFQGVGKVSINTLQFNMAPLSADGNFKKFMEDNWTPTNVNASYPRLTTWPINYQPSSFWIKSGAYLRLKNLQIGYNVPEKFVRKVGITHLRVYVAGQNLITWSPLNKYGIDPENPTDDRYYPQVKTYTCGVNVNF